MADDKWASADGLTGATREELEARIRVLEARLESKERDRERAERESADDAQRRERRRTEIRDNVETTRDVTDRTFDEASRLFRAFTQAHIEGLRAVTDTVGTFADELSKRRDERDEKDRDRDALATLPGDLYAGYIRAVDEAMKIPGRTSEKFQDSYRRTRDDDKSDRV
jgi:chromosome segregation ATPase